MSRKLADRRARKRQKLAFWGIVALLLAFGVLVGDQRPHHLLMLHLEEKRTAARIAELKGEHAELGARHERLMEDAFALESLAREKGLARQGEIVYRIIPVPPDVHRATAESLAALARQRADSLARVAGDHATETR